jgi:hypothetical protein
MLDLTEPTIIGMKQFLRDLVFRKQRHLNVNRRLGGDGQSEIEIDEVCISGRIKAPV